MIKGFRCCCGDAVPFSQCLERSRTHPDDCPFVYPILQGMVNGIRGEVEGISVTSMLNCLRKVVLEKRPAGSKPFRMSARCPVCGAKLIRIDTRSMTSPITATLTP